jgi:hypothetical protein
MPWKSESKPKTGNVRIREGEKGGKQFQHNEETKKGMKRSIYDYPPKKK